MLNLILIFIGSGFGGVCRNLISRGVYAYFANNTFPYGTLVVNVLGSFFIGFLSVIFLSRFYFMSQYLRSLLIIGFLGGFTTFSAFSFETFNLIENRELFSVCLNIVASVFLSLIMTWLGILLGRTI